MSVFKVKSGLLPRFSEIWSTCLFVGYVKFMPGTLCSILSVIILYFCDISYNKNLVIALFFVLLIFSTYFVKNFLEEVKEKDPSFIVIDEFLGVFLGWILYFSVKPLMNYVIFLVLFRMFDILKPFPVNVLDSLSKRGGFLWQAFFIIADDLMASIMSYGVLEFIKRLGLSF